MKRVMLAGLALATALASLPAAAQNFGGYYEERGPAYGRSYGYEDERPRRREYREYREYPGERRGYREQRGYYEERGPRRVQSGSLCVTSRGSCPTGQRLPANSPCGCNIPGFGYKRGAIGAGT